MSPSRPDRLASLAASPSVVSRAEWEKGLPETPRPGWEDPVGKDQRFGDSIAIASSIERLCQAKI